MIELIYKNDQERTIFFGGANATWKLVTVEGLGLAPKTFSTAVYPGIPGAELTGESIGARTITLTADLRQNNETQLRLSQAAITLDRPGELILRVGYKSRKIGARCNALDIGDRNGAVQRCVFQFTCDYPYFEDTETTYIPVFARTPLLNKYFTFNGMFSKRVSRGEILSIGNIFTEPIFYIDVQHVPEESTTAEKGILITNHTTGQYIRLDYEPAQGEQITIDIPNRDIHNDAGENLIAYISDDTFLDGFYIMPGANDIEALNYSADTSMTVMCMFTNKYVEAVY